MTTYTYSHTATVADHADHVWEEWHAYVCDTAEGPEYVNGDSAGLCCHTCRLIIVETGRPAPEYVITDCAEHGVKVTGDGKSHATYVALAHACHDDGSTDSHGHYMAHVAHGTDCWVCCDNMTIDPANMAI